MDRTATEWMDQADAILRWINATQSSQIEAAKHFNVSKSEVNRFYRTRLWPKKIKDLIRANAALITAGQLSKLADVRWSDLPSGRSRGKRPNISIEAALLTYINGKKVLHHQDHHLLMQQLLQERSRRLKTSKELRELLEERSSLLKEIERLSTPKYRRVESDPNTKHIEDTLRFYYQCKVTITHIANGGLEIVFNAGQKEVATGLIESLLSRIT